MIDNFPSRSRLESMLWFTLIFCFCIFRICRCGIFESFIKLQSGLVLVRVLRRVMGKDVAVNAYGVDGA